MHKSFIHKRKHDKILCFITYAIHSLLMLDTGVAAGVVWHDITAEKGIQIVDRQDDMTINCFYLIDELFAFKRPF